MRRKRSDHRRRNLRGTLTVNRAISADVWLCGGGANGKRYSTSSIASYAGGGGGANHASDESAFAGEGYQGVVYIRWKKEDAV